MKAGSLERSIKLINPLAEVTKKRRQKTQTTNIRNERELITTGSWTLKE